MTVYQNPRGEVYHKLRSCASGMYGLRKMSRSEAREKGLRPCGICIGGSK